MDGAHGATLILVVRALPDVPPSAMLKLLERYAGKLSAQGGHPVLSGVQPPLVRLLERTGLEVLGADGIVPATPDLFGALDQALAATEERARRSRG
ncbi:hypothetical protein [Streptomyces sp. c-19]|uniref:hypothetical protein n=1 Tax=Streptomyces sp. c-19 TaxID=2789275 RepID=UPI00397EECD8